MSARSSTAQVTLGAEAVKRFGLKEGDKALVWGLSQAGRGERAASRKRWKSGAEG
jgi:hypothetical protein